MSIRGFLRLREAQALAAISVLSGCADSPLDPSRAAREARLTELPSAAIVGLMPSTASGRIAQSVPGFGGAYMEGGVLHVYVKSLIDTATARPAVIAELARGGRTATPIRFLPGTFSFAEFARWRALSEVFEDESVIGFDIDERKNRMRVFVQESHEKAMLEARARDHQIPASAFTVELRPNMEALAYLTDRFRPARAGFIVRVFYNQDGQNYTDPCTYGPNVTYNDLRHMVVNSHCTQVGSLGGLVNADVYQGTVSSSNKIGTEVADPHYTSSTYGCPSGQLCRYSDAALVKFTSEVIQRDIGGVARTTQRALLPSITGSTEIDVANPRFALSGELSSLFVGDTLDKVGQRTGWTAGIVESTCRNIQTADRPGYTTLCSIVVAAGTGKGDSGSPVFFKTSQGEYLLAGIVHAGAVDPITGLGQEYYASSWYNVNYELALGALDILNDPEGSGCQPPDPC